MIAGEAFAKINIGLRVGSQRADGFHPISGIFQSVSVADRLRLEHARDDTIESATGGSVVDGFDNLAFQAAAAVREVAGSTQPMRLTLAKTIPIAAGLAGGSADAAAGLVLAAELFDVGHDVLTELAPQLGSDVPFCLAGGTARVAGRGEDVAGMEPLQGFALAIVVPPVEISTPETFKQWDEMGEPEGLRTPSHTLPPVLRNEGDLLNDLYPAAVRIVPELDEWRSELERAWARPVMLSGSGPALFGFFVDHDEAAGAVIDIPIGTRFAEACDLSSVGWRITEV